jgi:CHAT domain-containing protein
MEQSVYDLAIYYESVRMKDPVKAFEYSEKSRARSLLDAVHRGAEVRKKGNEADLDLPAVTQSKSLAEIQAGMPANAQILQYVVLDDRLLMWIVTKSLIQDREVPMEAQTLTEKVSTYLETVKRVPAGDDADRSPRSEELYRILIAPAEPFLDKSKVLCIVPDKILHYLPYGALVSPATARYLIEDYDLSTTPSSSIFVDLSAAADRKGGSFDERLLSVGNPHFSRSTFDLLPDLPSAAREAQAVSDFYKKPRVFLYDEARETTIKAEIGKANVAHFAMHYVQNEQSEMLSGFPLTPEQATSNRAEKSDGFLQSYEIYGMKLPRMRLVILSGCSTGIERQYRGEGAVGVARPFLVAGVPIVVASLWPVDSDSSADLMASFHRHRLRDPLPVSQALRRAQIEMIHGEDMRYRHPYYWAPFLAIGGLSPY